MRDEWCVKRPSERSSHATLITHHLFLSTHVNNSKERSLTSMPQTLTREKAAPAAAPKSEPEILFQKYFKSVGPRTYAAQIKKASNGNHFIVLTEGKRDDKSDQVRKTKLFVFSE